MAVLLILAVAVGSWLVSAWVLMLFAGFVHSEVLTAVIPFSFETGLKFALFTLLISLFVTVNSRSSK